jgi:hypothetical protein
MALPKWMEALMYPFLAREGDTALPRLHYSSRVEGAPIFRTSTNQATKNKRRVSRNRRAIVVEKEVSDKSSAGGDNIPAAALKSLKNKSSKDAKKVDLRSGPKNSVGKTSSKYRLFSAKNKEKGVSKPRH